MYKRENIVGKKKKNRRRKLQKRPLSPLNSISSKRVNIVITQSKKETKNMYRWLTPRNYSQADYTDNNF